MNILTDWPYYLLCTVCIHCTQKQHHLNLASCGRLATLFRIYCIHTMYTELTLPERGICYIRSHWYSTFTPYKGFVCFEHTHMTVCTSCVQRTILCTVHTQLCPYIVSGGPWCTVCVQKGPTCTVYVQPRRVYCTHFTKNFLMRVLLATLSGEDILS